MTTIWNYFVKIIVSVWGPLSYIFGFPYEKQARKLDSEKIDPLFRGPENDKSNRTVYRANKVSN